MSTVDKNQAMIDFLQSCPTIQNNPLFFNFGNVENNANQINTQATDVSLHKTFIDGSEAKRYTFNIDSCKSLTPNQVVDGLSAENVDELREVQELIDWINAEGKALNYPDFGNLCDVDSMKCLTEEPMLLGVDKEQNPPIAIYRVSVQIDYTDRTDVLWNNTGG